MARTSNLEKARYRKLDEGKETCFFCARPSHMEDLTPNPKSSELDKETFQGEWVRVNACRACWGKIYTANIASGGAYWGARKGLMTLEQKQLLLSGTKASPQSERAIVLGFEQKYFVPTNTLMSDGKFIVNGASYMEYEVEALQATMALKYLGRPESHVLQALNQALAEGLLDTDSPDRYRIFAGLE